MPKRPLLLQGLSEENWKEHKQICKSLVVGASGSMQVQHSEESTVSYEDLRHTLSEDSDFTQFFKLFQESKPGGRRAAAREMFEIAFEQDHDTRESWVLIILIQLTYVDVDRLTWPSSPLLVLLECMIECDPTALLGGDIQSLWFSWLVNLMHPDGHHICYTRQILLAKQLVECGVLDVNVVMPLSTAPLQYACSNSVISLELIEFLLQSGADPNAKNHRGMTPLMFTIEWGQALPKS
jgi:hypothetical protein